MGLFLPVLLLAIVVGFIRGGRLVGFTPRDLRWVYPVVLAFLLRMLVQRLAVLWPESPQSWIDAMHAGSYGLLLLVVWLKRDWWPMRLFGAGTILNLIVIAANGWRMPVRLPFQATNPWSAETFTLAADNVHVLAGSTTKLVWLADVFWLPLPFSWLIFFSIGDVLLGGGLFWGVQRLMVGRGGEKPRECSKDREILR